MPLRSPPEAPAVLVTVCARQGPKARIATLGHELQHALEIARATAVDHRWPITCSTMERIGWRATRSAHASHALCVFETKEALVVGQQVARELSDRGLQAARVAAAVAMNPSDAVHDR